jgi:hypothetical protein
MGSSNSGRYMLSGRIVDAYIDEVYRLNTDDLSKEKK